jgi:C1A family cysteine protease/predicted phage tail protein
MIVQLSSDQSAALNAGTYGIFDKLTQHLVTYTLENNLLTLTGTQSLDQLRLAAFQDLSPVVDFLGGHVEVSIRMPANPGDTTNLRLESRNGTGFSWQVMDNAAYLPAADPVFEQHYAGSSSASREILTLRASDPASGPFTVKYSRGWDNSPAYIRVSIFLPAYQPDIDLSNPDPLILDVSQSQANPDISALAQLSALAVPSETSFDWRDAGIVPAVRDQGSCGGCWAFGTVGIMESALAKAGGPLTDLSERFLIDCNQSGWDCNGGLTAHAYHYNTLGKNQTQIGAVLESAKPYNTSYTLTCSSAYDHPYKLNGWQFITGDEWTVASVDQIKTAIYNYGPVTAGVCVGSNFNAYDSNYTSYPGYVMPQGDNANTVCGGYTNHQIILVGWGVDPTAGGYWILRNSWGSNWGMNGYMRIKWNDISRVGEGTSWVTVDPNSFGVPGPTLTAPAAGYTTGNTSMDFTWDSLTNAATYEIQIDDASAFSSPNYSSTGLTALTFTQSSLTGGTWYWRVRALLTDTTYTNWSASRSFTIDLTPPAVPTLSSPAVDAVTRTKSTTFSWVAPATAALYRLRIAGSDGTTIIHTSADLSSTSYLSPTLDYGTYFWQVQAADAYGNWSAYSAQRRLYSNPPLPLAPTLLTPDNSALIASNSPEFTWSTVDNAANYEFQLDATSPLTLPYLATATGSAASYQSTGLAEGVKYWRVRGISSAGEPGSWSLIRSITIDTVAPNPPPLNTPADNAPNIRGTPTFSWYSATSASQYQLQIADTTDFGTPVYTSDPTGSLSNKPASDLPIGTYYWHVRARDAAGNWSAYSAYRTVQILPPIPAAPSLTAPSNGYTTNDQTPDYSWSSVSYAVSYEIQIDDVSTFINPILQTGTSDTTTYTATALSSGARYWRVRGINSAAEKGSWSSYRSINIDLDPPGTPALSSPSNNAFVRTFTPTFTWLAPRSAAAYRLYLNDTSDFSNDAAVKYISTELTSLSHTSPTLDLGAYYWCVKARDAAGNWSSCGTPRSFEVRLPIPSAPTLTSPSAGSSTNDTTPTFAWSAPANAVVYQFQFDNSSTFPSPIDLDLVATEPTYTIPDTSPISNGNFYWRVRAANIHGEFGAWSSIWKINIDTVNPAVPSLSSPSNGAVVRSTPTFSWVSASGASAYQFRYDQASDFPDPDYTSAFLNSLNHKPPTMTVSVHYWQVRSRDAAGNYSDWSSPRSVEVRQQIPSAPLLTSPGDKSNTNDVTPEFVWSTTSYASSYELQLGASSTFIGTPVFTGTTTSTSLVIPDTSALSDGTKYWRVRAINIHSEPGSWSVTRSLMVDTVAPNPPQLSSPADGAAVRGTPSFTWLAAGGTAQYQAQLSSDVDFTNPWESGWSSALSVSPPNQPLGTYYWRVRGKDSAGNISTYSPARSVIIDSPVPPPPSLTTPNDGWLTNNSSVDFNWSSVFYAEGYEIQVDNSNYFTSPVDFSQTILKDGDGNLATGVTITGITDGKRYWRVRSVNLYNEKGSWSKARFFTVDTNPPNPPTLYSPAGNTIIRASSSKFSWLAASGANAYQFAYSTNADCSSPVYESGVTTSLAHYPQGMAVGDYYWCVKARDAAQNWSAYSSGRAFFVRPPILSAPGLNAPSNGSLTMDSTPEFSWYAVTGAADYEFQIASQNTFSSPIETTVVAATSYTPSNPLPYGVLYWRVRSRNTSGEPGTWSGYRSLTQNSFDSQFNGSSTGWISYPAGYWYLDGSNFASNGIGGKWVNAYHTSTQTNFVYEARLKRSEAAAIYSSFGIYIRGNSTFNSGNYYNNDIEFLVKNSGIFSVWKVVNGVDVNIVPWTVSAALLPNDWNTLRITANGSTVSFYINGVLVYSGTDLPTSAGKVGLLQYRSALVDETIQVDYATLGPLLAAAPANGTFVIDQSLAGAPTGKK